MSREIDDITLIKAFCAGDKAAFDRLVLRHKDKVFNLCYRFLGDYEEANDCAQETFVKAFRSLKRFKQRSAFSTWIYRIAVNTCKNRLASLEYRYHKKMRRLDDESSIRIRDESHSPAARLERKEKEVLIQKAIDSLPKEQKAVIVLRYIQGLSYKEVAEITGHNPGTVKSKLSRAREQLKMKLRGVI
ncbi:sigma-70 family RNA polymerase sigma factor [bacterium]|nr:sigma-70 family RNA polymerase sigma factor [bacterium]MBU1614866.1 sigma-70 family RNA polymerase sigma factor [bacterium]